MLEEHGNDNREEDRSKIRFEDASDKVCLEMTERGESRVSPRDM